MIVDGTDWTKIKCPRDEYSQHIMRNWGKRKLKRYAELIEQDRCTEEAFEIVEYNKGVIDED